MTNILPAVTDGIDLSNSFGPYSKSNLCFKKMDAISMEYRDNSFDFVYSHHCLEHTPDFKKVLQEIKRVLVPHGGYLIGTPNKNRVLGYINSEKTTFSNKILWNLNDYKMRLLGKFTNQSGAHAGFSSRELYYHLSTVFGNSEEISCDFYSRKYPSKLTIINFLERAKLKNFLYPSVYFIGKNIK